ncbi:MAG: C1 family peptidase [Mucilaginibacter sp.]|nr:C1 family peptidase [Mucilaginibacter sp.]
MKITYKSSALLVSAIVMLVLYSCSKSETVAPAPVDDQQQSSLPSTADGKHLYGLLPSRPDQYSTVPVYSPELFKQQYGTFTIGKPPVVTLANPAVRDQGQIGSCTSFCGVEAYEIGYYYKHGAFPTLLSPLFIYYEERVGILHERISADNGAYMVDIGEALQKYGDCYESLYKYPNPASDRSTAYRTAPSSAAISNALGYKVTGYTLVNSGDTAAVKNLLRNNVPVMMGFNVYDNTSTYQYFEGLNTTSYTYNPLNSNGSLANGVSLLGGHAVPLIGYDDNRKAFLVQNSWGTSWGNNGFFYLPYSVFMSTTVVPQGGVYYLTL